MRAGLLHAWPALSHHFGLKPWHVHDLTEPELLEYLAALKEIQRQQAER